MITMTAAATAPVPSEPVAATNDPEPPAHGHSDAVTAPALPPTPPTPLAPPASAVLAAPPTAVPPPPLDGPTAVAVAPRPVPEAQPPLAASLARLRSRDGTHELRVQLHPAELGAVNVSATIRNGALTVTVACADQRAQAAVTAALPNLHHDLQNAGFTGVDVSVGNPPPEQRESPGQTPQAPPDPRHQHGDIGQRDTAERRHAPSDAGLDRWL
ncbi:MAG: hypothetical protein JWO57_3110 [Pseudonocardiales bacterium]|nr:hypothetical protein [Pseudonocardiales bacterium]